MGKDLRKTVSHNVSFIYHLTTVSYVTSSGMDHQYSSPSKGRIFSHITIKPVLGSTQPNLSVPAASFPYN